MENKEFFIGIDYGTSFSSVGIYMNSTVKIVPSKIGEVSIPSIVSFSDDKIYIGEECIGQKIEEKNIISEVKRFIGLDYDEFIKSDFAKKLNYDVINQNNKPKIKVIVKGKEELYSPEEISAFIIRKVVKNAEDFIGKSIKKAVISVPANFRTFQEKAICSAARLADIEVKRMVKEPTAASLAYGFGNELIPENDDLNVKLNALTSLSTNKNENVSSLENKIIKKEQNLLIFDLGGGTFDVTLLNLNKNTNNFEIIATTGLSDLGGSDFNNRLIDYCIKKFCLYNDCKEEDIRNDKKAYKKLSNKCEIAKKLLSISRNAEINIVDFFQNQFFSETITIDLFEKLCHDLFEKIKLKIIGLLNNIGKQPEYIDAVILVGGATRMIGIKNLLISIFKDERKIKDNINPDNAVAIGATLVSAKIEKKSKINFVLQDIIPYNLGISTANPNYSNEEIIKGDLMCPLIKKNTKIPCCSEEKTFYQTLTKEFKNIHINIYEGNGKYVKDNKKLDIITLDELNYLGKIEYKLIFKVDENSKLTVDINIDALNKHYIKNIKEEVTNAFLNKDKKKIIINKSKTINTFKSVISNINNIKKTLFNSDNIIDIIENLIYCSQEYEELINNYMVIGKDNEFILEKIYINTKDLFNLYLQRIIIKKSNEDIKDNVQDILNKIKERMYNLISIEAYVSDLMGVFINSRKQLKEVFFEIFFIYMELMNNEGKRRLEEKQYSRYYSKLYFEKAFYSYKKNVTFTNIATIDRDNKIIKKLEDQFKITEDNLKIISSFAFVIENLVKENNYLYGSTGFTNALKKIEKLNNPEELTEEELQELFDLFNNMADSYDQNDNCIGEAFCLSNIIKISYKIIKTDNYDQLLKYVDRFKKIMEHRSDEKYKWLKEINGIIEAIEKENQDIIKVYDES